MNRSTRQSNHLEQKIAAKEGRGTKRPGKKTKRWKKARDAQQATPVAA